jgi:RHS repeat-associated protein
MKKYICSLILTLFVCFGFAQAKKDVSKTNSIGQNGTVAAAGAGGGSGIWWYRDRDLDGYGEFREYTFAEEQPEGCVSNNLDCNDRDATINPDTVWYLDSDHDGFGTSASILYQCTQPTNYVRNASDCNDGDASLTPSTIWYLDADHDGFGTSASTLTQCAQPVNYVRNASDCNDANASVRPNTVWYLDADHDGFGTSASTLTQCTQPTNYVLNASDCNDGDASLTPNTIWYLDADHDGFGTSASVRYQCTQPANYVRNASDCNDGDASLTPSTIWYLDADHDGFGTSASVLYQCTQPANYVRNASDCNDGDVSLTPNTIWYLDSDHDGFGTSASKLYQCTQPANYVRNASDCNDGDASLTPNTIWYLDADHDGFGTSVSKLTQCTQPTNYVRNASDCNDGDASLTPSTIWYLDADHDGFGTSSSTLTQCTQPVNYVRNASDCNDADVTLTPNTIWYRDADVDGYGTSGITLKQCTQPAGYVRNANDCNDGDGSLTPNTIWYLDADHDGFGTSATTLTQCIQPTNYVRNANDCNDGDVTLTPNTIWYLDADHDGFGTSATTLTQCTQPANYVRNASDYNDTTVNITNIAPQTFYQDADSDGFGNPNISVYYSVKPGGYVTNNSDYNDTTVNITNIVPQTFYQDADGDGFGNPNISVYYSVKPGGYATNNTDCDDTNSGLNPNTKWYSDNDQDGLGDPSSFVQQCIQPAGNYVSNNTDNCPLIKGTSPDCSDIVSPSADYNYRITKTYKQPTNTVWDYPGVNQVQTAITYFDGLGRPVQQIANRQSSSGKDIVTHIGYDDFGRQTKDYLPFAGTTSNMAYDTNALTNTLSYYKGENYEYTDNPFSEKKLESSPLDRVLKQAAPGYEWAMNGGHEIKLNYQTNTDTEVKLYRATTTWNAESGLYDIAFTDNGNYAANQLYKTITYDENSAANPIETAGSTVEFKNKEGKVILKRTYESGIKHDTYYVYDSYGNLTYVIPPKADGTINQTILDDLCYQYKYDDKNHLVEKKLPGKQWEYIVYDKLDRPVLIQDANLRASGKWIFTKYDAFSRPVYTGEYVNNTQTSRVDIQTLANSTNVFESKQATAININGTNVNYTNNVFPTTGTDLFTITYYDDYSNIDLDGGAASVSYGITPITNAKGLNTCSKVRVLGKTSWITNVNYYDAKGRVVYNYSKNNYLSTISSVKTQLDFVGKTIETTSTHKKGTNAEITIKDAFEYDHVGRLLTQKQTINNQAQEVIASNTYDELGQLTSKGVGGKITQSRLQNVNYTYTIRGWLKGINDINVIGNDLFSFKIYYNTPTTGTRLFNGNISQTFWKTANTDNILKNYTYSYDNLNRLTQAIDNLGHYNERPSYDKNGNITTMSRNGLIPNTENYSAIDNLVYTYDGGNKLLKVEDASGSTEGFNNRSNTAEEYTYDANGNMKTDANKGITAITYNYLNLPTQVVFASGSIDYVYDATGVKQQKTVNGNTTDYAGGFQYENNILQFFPQPEGYVANAGGIFSYIYQYKDHLGNVRLSYGDGNNDGFVNTSEIVEENNYYPFGLKQRGYNKVTSSLGNATAQKYKYNGKEFQDELGLNMTAMDFRQYDSALGRFNAIDALAELSYSVTPNHFGYNNPNYWADPSGLISEEAIKAMWNNSANNASTTWTNGGGGNFDSSAGNGWVNADSGTFNEYTFSLPEVKVGSKSSNWASKFEQHTYDNSPFYKHDDPYKPAGDTNAVLGVVASGVEGLSGLTRVGTNATLYTPGAAGRVFYGNQYVSTFGLSKIGTAIGRGSFAAGVIMDGVGMYNYYQNPTSSHVVSPAKMGLNATIGYIGLEGGPPGAILSGIYFLGDAFIPGTTQEPGGGWPAAIEAGARNTEGNRAILGSSWSPRPCGGL